MRHVSLALLVCFGMATFAGPASADRPDLERLIPADCYLLVKLPNITKSREAFRQTGLGKLMAEPEVQAFIKSLMDPFADKIAEGKKKAEADLGVPLDDALKLLAGEISVSLWKPNAPAGQGPPVTGMATVDYGENTALVLTLLAQVAKKQGVKLEAKDYKGTKLIIIPPKRRGAMPMAYALHQGRLLFSPMPDALQRAIDLGAGDGTGTLAKHARYSAASSAHGGSGVENARIYADVTALKGTFWDKMPPKAQAVVKALEVDQWDSLSYSNRFDGAKVYDTFHVATASRGGLAGALTPMPLKVDGIKVHPDDLSYFAGTYDLAALYRVGIAAVAAADPAAAEKAEQAIQGFEKKSGFSLDGWLGSLGNRMIQRTWMPQYGLMPYSVLSMELKDPAAFTKNMQALAKSIEMEWVTKTYKGKTVHHWRPKVGEFGKMGAGANPMALALSFQTNLPTHFVVEGNWAHFADMHQTIAEWVDRKDGSVEWRQIEAGPDDTHVARAGTAQKRSLAAMYNTMLPFVAMFEGILRKAGVGFDARHLPRAGTITKHFERSAFSISSKGGITARSQDNIGLTPASIAVVGVAAAMLLPVLSKVKDKANRSNSKNNLKQLGLAMILYRDSKGKAVHYPPHKTMVSQLFTSGITSEPMLFADPVTGQTPTADDLRNHRAEKLGYIGTPHPILSIMGSSERPVIWDRGTDNKRIVLFLDGHVEEISEWEFKTLMDKLEARVARLKKEGKKPLHLPDKK